MKNVLFWRRMRVTYDVMYFSSRLLCAKVLGATVITGRINAAGNAVASIRPSVRLPVCLFPLHLQNR